MMNFRVSAVSVLRRLFSTKSSVGIIGLPNIGKSTLFNALTKTQLAEAANYPFCTIDPNKAKLSIPNSELEEISGIYPSERVIPSQLEIVDVAGLIKGAHKGEGLGNKFLTNVREVSVIIHLIRCFEDESVIHVEKGPIDPVRDVETIHTELILSDLQFSEKKLGNVRRKPGDQYRMEENALKECISVLNEGISITKHTVSSETWRTARSFGFLSSKPVIYVANVNEDVASVGNQHTKHLEEYVRSLNSEQKSSSPVVTVSAMLEEVISSLEDDSAREEFLRDMGMSASGLEKLIAACGKELNLHWFYTVGPKEARSWNLEVGANAVEAASKIHTDIAEGFIMAEVITKELLKEFGDEKKIKEAGKVRMEGKDYIVQKGDIMHFKFSKKRTSTKA